jgi:hypothetical protein
VGCVELYVLLMAVRSSLSSSGIAASGDIECYCRFKIPSSVIANRCPRTMKKTGVFHETGDGICLFQEPG